MPTDQDKKIDPSPPTAAKAPPAPTAPAPVDETAQQKLKDAEERAKAAETEAKRWKNRVVKLTKPDLKKKEKDEDLDVSDVDEEESYTDWRIDNRERIKTVKDKYEEHLTDLQVAGAILTTTLREKALKLAELDTGISGKKSYASEEERQAAMSSPTATINRATKKDDVEVTPDQASRGITPDMKKKWKSEVEAL